MTSKQVLRRQTVDVGNLFCAKQREAVDDVEVILDKDKKSFDRVEALNSSASEHVRYLSPKQWLMHVRTFTVLRTIKSVFFCDQYTSVHFVTVYNYYHIESHFLTFSVSVLFNCFVNFCFQGKYIVFTKMLLVWLNTFSIHNTDI